MSIKAHRTIYRGVEYRSRLEAKWAAFFDELGWTYEYEPFDCPGWTPDFLIHGEHPILCEVKPTMSYDAELYAKAQTDDPKYDILLLGCAVPVHSHFAASFAPIGWFRFQYKKKWYLADACPILLPAGKYKQTFGIVSHFGPSYDRITGEWMPEQNWQWTMKSMQTLWAIAKNKTQWKGAQSETTTGAPR